MEFTNPGWKALTSRDLLIPSYLREKGEEMALVAPSLANIVAEFLEAAAQPLDPVVRRMASSVYQPEDGPAFDCHRLNGANSVRLMIPSATIDVLCPILFGGNVKEQPLRTAAGQGLANKIAETLLMEALQSYDTPVLSTPNEEPLSDAPLLCIDFRFEVAGHGELAVTAAFTRPLTDQLGAVPTPIQHELVTAVRFPATAVVAEQLMPIDFIDEWKPGTIVPLRHASTEVIRLLAMGEDSRTPFAAGELGVDNGMRCLRITDVGVDESGESAPTASGGPSGFSAAPSEPSAAEEPFEIPMADGFGEAEDPAAADATGGEEPAGDDDFAPLDFEMAEMS